MKCLKLILMAMSISLFATSFIPINVKDKLEDSDAVIMGTYESSISKKDSSGMIVTEATINIEKSVGISFNPAMSKNKFKLRFPGGSWGGLVHTIEGVPRFKQNEKVVLLLKAHQQNYWVHHLAAGKYSVLKKNGEEILVSDIFSSDEGVGRLSLNSFQNTLKNSHFSSGLVLHSNFNEKKAYVATGPTKKRRSGRSPASISKSGHNEIENIDREPSSVSNSDTRTNLLIIVFIFMGLFFTYRSRRE